jgi:hypothetical protein
MPTSLRYIVGRISKSIANQTVQFVFPLALVIATSSVLSIQRVGAQVLQTLPSSRARFKAEPTVPIEPIRDLSSGVIPSFDSVQIINHSRPDSREITLFASPEHPVCSVRNKSADNWLLYYCGHATEWAKQRERYQTVYVYAGEDQYKTHHRVAGFSWWAANLMAIGAGVADVEITQWDIRHRPLGREGNPLMGKTRAQAYAVTGGVELLTIITSLHRKRAMMINDEIGIQHGAQFWNRLPWWTPYAGQITAHALGIASGLAGR